MRHPSTIFDAPEPNTRTRPLSHTALAVMGLVIVAGGTCMYAYGLYNAWIVGAVDGFWLLVLIGIGGLATIQTCAFVLDNNHRDDDFFSVSSWPVMQLAWKLGLSVIIPLIVWPTLLGFEWLVLRGPVDSPADSVRLWPSDKRPGSDITVKHEWVVRLENPWRAPESVLISLSGEAQYLTASTPRRWAKATFTYTLRDGAALHLILRRCQHARFASKCAHDAAQVFLSELFLASEESNHLVGPLSKQKISKFGLGVLFEHVHVHRLMAVRR